MYFFPLIFRVMLRYIGGRHDTGKQILSREVLQQLGRVSRCLERKIHTSYQIKYRALAPQRLIVATESMVLWTKKGTNVLEKAGV
jgi:hypothetical protein